MSKRLLMQLKSIGIILAFNGSIVCHGQIESSLSKVLSEQSKAKELAPIQAATATQTVVRSASSLAVPNFHLEGFPGIADDNTKAAASPAGALSSDYLVTAQNNGLRVQDRKGKELSFTTLESLFSQLGPFRGLLLMPRVVYDANAKRFIVAAIADPFEATSAVLLAVSKTSDPRGDWRMTRTPTPYSGTYFSKMNMAVAGKILAISADVSDLLGYDSTQNYLYALANIYAESPNFAYQKFEDYLEVNAPASDPNPEATRILFVNNSYNLVNGNYVMAFKEAKLNPGGSTFNVGSRSFADAGDIYQYYPGEVLPQAGTDKKINAGGSIIQNCTTRDTSVWCVNTMFVRFGAEMRSVVQYTRANWPINGAVTLAERVRVDDITGGTYFAFPSIAANKNGDLFIGYNRFRSDKFVGAYFAHRKSTDVSGGLYLDGVLKEGEDSFERSPITNVFGTYSSAITDPVDDTSFWTIQNYAASRTEGGTPLWGTWWTHFSQHNGACTYKVDQSALDVPISGGAFKVIVIPSYADCTWMVAPNAGWLRQTNILNSVGIGTTEFAATLNRRGVARTATIRIGDQLVTVRQAANPQPLAAEPTLSVTRFAGPTTMRIGESVIVTVVVRNNGTKSAPKFRIGFYLGTGVTVTTKDIDTGVGCIVTTGLAIDATTTCTSTLTLDPSLPTGTYSLAAIADDAALLPITDRSASTRLSDAGSLVVKAAATAPAVSSAGIVSGATALVGPVAPGSILVIYGARLGPAALTTLTLDAQGRVSKTLGETRVLFDGVAAPMIYTSASQASAIVPYSVEGKTTTQVVMEYRGQRGEPVMLPVARTAPGFFSVDYSGKNQVAALNEDGSVNSAGNPVGAGQLIVFYGTGAGTFKTPPVDGAVIGAPVPEFLAPLSLKIGGLDAELLYAGPAPGLVSGVFQINARVPDAVEPGDKVLIQLKSGANDSPVGTTIAVK